MKAVRFKKEYSDIPDVRLSYELFHDYFVVDYDTHSNCLRTHYYTKLLGLVPTYKMEPSEDTDTPAIDVFVALSNIKS